MEIVNFRGGAAHFCLPAQSEPRGARRGAKRVRAIFIIHRIKMKTLKSVLIIIIVLPLIVIILGATKTNKDIKPKEKTNLPDDSWSINLAPEVSARQLCYIWNTEAGDSAKLSMDLRADKVIGEFYWLPFAKDKKTGVFKGSVTPMDPMTSSRTVSAIWEVSAEGMINKEEIKIIFGEGTANVGFGKMKDRGDGVFIYANPDKLYFGPNLQQTDCGDEAMD